MPDPRDQDVHVPVDPTIQAMLTALEQLGAPPLTSGTPTRAREGFRRLTVDVRQPEQVVAVGEVEDRRVDGGDGPIGARVYRPDGADGTVPTVLFVHGGGFVIGDLDTHDNQARRICAGTGAVVVSIDYRLAPEHPWPAAYDDAVAAFRWVVAHVDELGGDPDRLGVAGDSAGGNLSALVAVTARDEGLPLAAQLLVYPAVDFAGDHPSRTENAEGYFLTDADMRWFAQHYLGVEESDADEGLLRDPRLSPLHVDLAGVAPAVVVTAQFDPLRDEGDAYAAALAAAGVPVDHLARDGMIHGFFDMFPWSPGAEEGVAAAVAAFAARLTSPRTG